MRQHHPGCMPDHGYHVVMGLRPAAGTSDTLVSQFVASYLAPPQTAAPLSVRPRLLRLLKLGSGTPVTLISGEPASGKTSALLQLLASDGLSGRTVVWLTVPPNTEDDITFWEYLVAAIDSSAAGSVRVDDLRAALNDREPPTADWLTTLANRLGGPHVGPTIVIDDLHELKAPGAIASLGRLLEIIPTDVAVLVATRVIPDWPLADWRMSGRLTEIDSRDLAVTVDEARDLLRASSLEIGDDDVARLVDRTEGWVGGIKLASLAIQRQSDPSKLIAEFSSTNELLSTYLLRCVLDRQADDVRTFLHDISVLDTMSPELCDEIRQADDSAELLERCRAANLFLGKVGRDPGLYRLHALVRELLHAELERCRRDRFVTLHREASRAFERAGEIDRAIRHAITAGEFDRVNELVISYAPQFAHRARFDELRRWADLIRGSGAKDSASTTLALASTLNLSGQGTEALRLLDEVDEDTVPESILDLYALIRVSSHMVLGDVHMIRPLAERLGRDVGARRPKAPGPFDGTVTYLQGVGAFMEGALDDAAELLELADQPERRPLPPAYIAVSSWAALVAVHRGDISHAERCVESATRRREALASADSAPFAPALLASAELAWEQNRLGEAAELFVRARRSVEPMPWLTVLVECARSRVRVSRGETRRALDELLEVSKLVLSSEGSPLLRAVVAERAVDICLEMADVEAALGWVHTHERCETGALPWATRIRLTSAVDPNGWDRVSAEALAAPEPLPRRVDTLLTVAAGEDDEQVAQSQVAEALRLSEPGRIIRRFVDAGPRIASLVNELAADPRRAGGSDVSRFFAAVVADACASRPAGPASPAPVADELVDQLTAREVEVLSLLDSGKSYSEIGTELFVSRNTVKSHVQHIYTKLGTSGRDGAVEMGRRLGLIM